MGNVPVGQLNYQHLDERQPQQGQGQGQGLGQGQGQREGANLAAHTNHRMTNLVSTRGLDRHQHPLSLPLHPRQSSNRELLTAIDLDLEDGKTHLIGSSSSSNTDAHVHTLSHSHTHTLPSSNGFISLDVTDPVYENSLFGHDQASDRKRSRRSFSSSFLNVVRLCIYLCVCVCMCYT